MPDGIIDPKDKCPEDPGLSGSDGCPAIASNDHNATGNFVPQPVYFSTDYDDFGPSFTVPMNELTTFMLANKDYNVRISGHTDSYGNKLYNQQLSVRRAKYCSDYLIEKGISMSRIKYRGYGEDQPKEENSNEDGRKLNRRVEFQLYKAGKSDK